MSGTFLFERSIDMELLDWRRLWRLRGAVETGPSASLFWKA
jgi:hypothetical protein